MRTSASELAERLHRKRFERMVRRAMDSLPSDIRSLMVNVEVVIADEPNDDQRGDDEDGPLGLYEGIPLTERESSYGLVLPDKITLFQGPLERATIGPADLFAEMRTTLIHEIAHHFGMDEWQIAELGYE